jgi:hypothetical protein
MANPMGREPRHENPARDAEANQDAAETIRRWLSRPRHKANVGALACVSLTMLALALAPAGVPDRSEVLRGTALFFCGIHSVLHLTWIHWLKRQRDSGIVEADTALQAYRDPRRVTGLDLAMAWLMFAAFAPAVDSFISARLATGG